MSSERKEHKKSRGKGKGRAKDSNGSHHLEKSQSKSHSHHRSHSNSRNGHSSHKHSHHHHHEHSLGSSVSSSSTNFPLPSQVPTSADTYTPPTRFERRLDVRPFENTPISKSRRHYLIWVKTGDRSYSNANAPVYLTLVSKLGATPEFSLQRTFESGTTTHFERSATTCYSVETEDIGVPELVKLRHGGDAPEHTWFLDWVSVRAEGQTEPQMFPYYKWILGGAVDIFLGDGSLPQQPTLPEIQSARSESLEAMMEAYRWSSDNVLMLPGFIADGTVESLPLDDQLKYDNVRKKHYYGSFAREITEDFDIVNVAAYAGRLEWDSIEDLSMLFFDDFEAPRIIDTWAADEEFGRQLLNGCNPTKIKRCTAMPSNFPVTTSLLSHILGANTTLESLMAEDYKDLDGVPTYANGGDVRYVTAPLCLLYVDSKGELLPPGKHNPIFTPEDSEADWTIAKIWVRCADTHHHQIHSLLLNSHLLVEAVAVALLRNFAIAHPIYKLLRPHFRNTIAINVMLRRELIDSEGPTAHTLGVAGGGHLKYLETCFASWSFRDWIIPENIKLRGVQDSKALPHYFWRDDALALWGVMHSFVSKVMNHYYKSAQEVQSDTELSSFMNDLHTHGFKGHDFPAKVQTLEELIEVVTALLYNASACHAAFNYSQFDSYAASVAHQPRAMYEPPPKAKGVQTLNTILTLLPSGDEAIVSVGMAYELSRYSKAQTFLGSYPERLFTSAALQGIISEFQDALWRRTREIHSRNVAAEVPYVYLSPDRIPNSVTV